MQIYIFLIVVSLATFAESQENATDRNRQNATSPQTVPLTTRPRVNEVENHDYYDVYEDGNTISSDYIISDNETNNSIYDDEITVNETIGRNAYYDEYDEAKVTIVDGSGGGGSIPTDDDDYSEGLINDKPWNKDSDHVCEGGFVIPPHRVCDGIIDCLFDCSDEIYCKNTGNIFLCHQADRISPPYLRSNNFTYSFDNPRCIAFDEFCDGAPQCATEDDEQKDGPGFKCKIRGKHRSCILPTSMVCDENIDCEDRSDDCDSSHLNFNAFQKFKDSIDWESKPRIAPQERKLFHCLSKDNNEVIFEHQVCNGVFDCSDLSDECLCQIYQNDVINDVCSRLCAHNDKSDENCMLCKTWEYYWKDETSQTTQCLNSSEVLQRKLDQVKNIFVWKPPKANGDTDTKSSRMVVQCFDQRLTKGIMATKCDGRPECFFGEDECGAGCELEPKFCQLLIPDYGYSCNDSTTNTIANPIVMCDGVKQCHNGIDEEYCPKRTHCEENDPNSGTIDVSQLCDGYEHCTDGGDEKIGRCDTDTWFKCETGPNDTSVAHVSQLWNGESDCAVAWDECPVYLLDPTSFQYQNVLKIHKKKYNIDLKGIVRRSSVTDGDKAISSMPVQIFIIIGSLLGICLLFVALSVALYWSYEHGSRQHPKIQNLDPYQNSILVIQETFLHVTLVLSKICICLFFLVYKLKRWKDAEYCTNDLRIRSSFNCSLMGALCLVALQIPIFTLVVNLLICVFQHLCCFRSRLNIRRQSFVETGTDGVAYKEKKPEISGIFLMITLILSYAITWFPISYIAYILVSSNEISEQFVSYAWIKSTGFPELSVNNLYTRDQLMRVVQHSMSLKSGPQTQLDFREEFFTFDKMAEAVNNALPTMRFSILGKFGYFSQNVLCLPPYIMHDISINNTYGMNVESNSSWYLSTTLLCMNGILLFFVFITTIFYTKSVKSFHVRATEGRFYKNTKLLLYLSLNETIFWVIVFVCRIISFKYPEKIEILNYITIVTLVINSAIIAPFLLIKRSFKFETTSKVRLPPPNTRSSSSRVQESIRVKQKLLDKPSSITNVDTSGAKVE